MNPLQIVFMEKVNQINDQAYNTIQSVQFYKIGRKTFVIFIRNGKEYEMSLTKAIGGL